MKRFFFLFLSLISSALFANPTVIGLHGLFQDSRTLLTAKKALERACFDVYLWDYPSRRYSIECHATHLITVMQDIARCKPGEPIYFVTHSVGANIVRAALNLPGCPEEAKMGKAVLLAPPSQGSSLARRFQCNPPVSVVLGEGVGYDLMTMTGEDMSRCFGEFPEKMPVLVIAGSRGVHSWFCEPNDGYISISETYPNTPHQHMILPVNHGALLTSPYSLYAMVQFFCCPATDPCPATEEVKEKETKTSLR